MKKNIGHNVGGGCLLGFYKHHQLIVGSGISSFHFCHSGCCVCRNLGSEKGTLADQSSSTLHICAHGWIHFMLTSSTIIFLHYLISFNILFLFLFIFLSHIN